MSRRLSLVLVTAMLVCLFTATLTFARAPKKYQVTGKVLEVTADFIAVDKAGERWEIGRDSSTKVTGSLKVGDKVTIEYQMTASRVETSDAKGK